MTANEMRLAFWSVGALCGLAIALSESAPAWLRAVAAAGAVFLALMIIARAVHNDE